MVSDEVKSEGYASWYACLKRQEVASKSQREGGRQKGDEDSTGKETTGTHRPANLQIMPEYNGEQNVMNGGGLHPNTWQSKGVVKPETTTIPYSAKSLETPIGVDKYQEILDYWSIHGKQEPPRGGKSQGTMIHGSSKAGLESEHHKQYRHRHRNRNSHTGGAKVYEVDKNLKSSRIKDDEDVWFRVPGDMDVKLSHHG